MPNLPSRRRIRSFVKPFRVTDGKKFKLKHIDPDDTGRLKSKEQAAKLLAAGVERLAELQDRLYAQDKWSVLLVFQAMDAAGKDGTIKHVMSGVNPTGCQVFSFKAPVLRGARPRLHVAVAQGAARAWAHRHLQSLVLRGDARRARAPGAVARAEAAAAAGDRRDLEGAFRGHLQHRAVPRPQRRRRPQVLPARVEGRAEETVPLPPAAAGEELEVLHGRRQGAELLGRLSARVRGHDPAHGQRACAVARRARGPQVVHAAGRCRRDHRSAGGPGADSTRRWTTTSARNCGWCRRSWKARAAETRRRTRTRPTRRPKRNHVRGRCAKKSPARKRATRPAARKATRATDAVAADAAAVEPVPQA